MGKGNTNVQGKYEGLYFVSVDYFNIEDEDGTAVDFDQFQFDDFIDSLQTHFEENTTSFTRCDKWMTQDNHAILENALFYITIEDNEWSFAIKLIQKDAYDYTIENFQKRHYKTYLKKLKDYLLSEFKTIHERNGAWMSTPITKETTVYHCDEIKYDYDVDDYEVLNESEKFNTLEEAQAFANNNTDKDWLIVDCDAEGNANEDVDLILNSLIEENQS